MDWYELLAKLSDNNRRLKRTPNAPHQRRMRNRKRNNNPGAFGSPKYRPIKRSYPNP